MTAVEERPAGAEPDGAAIEAFAMRLLGSAVAMMDLATIRVGQELGLYEALTGQGALTSSELAQQTSTDERYVREWLEQQSVTDILTVTDAAAAPEARRYTLSPAKALVLVDRSSPAYLGALGNVTEMPRVLPALVESFRSGRGVPWAHYGDGARSMQAELNRPGYLNSLAQEWLPAMPDIERRLRSTARPRIADVGCGAGWSSIAFALAYPNAVVDGLDADDASIADARRHAAEAGVADRVRFEVYDARAIPDCRSGRTTS